ncbi:MAG: hypothetical protein J6U26_05885 [Lachnospiraceae bacterium]|nr:hypothetical protein [Lachnospiraceae bacterium]
MFGRHHDPVDLSRSGNPTAISGKQLKASLPDNRLNRMTTLNPNHDITLYYLGQTLTVYPEDTDSWYALHLSLTTEDQCALYVLCMTDESKISGRPDDIRVWDMDFDRTVTVEGRTVSYRQNRVAARQTTKGDVYEPEKTGEYAMWRENGSIYFMSVIYPEVVPSVEESREGGTMEQILELMLDDRVNGV